MHWWGEEDEKQTTVFIEPGMVSWFCSFSVLFFFGQFCSFSVLFDLFCMKDFDIENKS